MHGNFDVVKLLVDEGCNTFIRSHINRVQTESNLSVASRWGHIEILIFLLEMHSTMPLKVRTRLSESIFVNSSRSFE
jgi:ankyrin repeat protein